MTVYYLIETYDKYNKRHTNSYTFEDLKERAKHDCDICGWNREPDSWRSASDLIDFIFSDRKSVNYRKTRSDMASNKWIAKL